MKREIVKLLFICLIVLCICQPCKVNAATKAPAKPKITSVKSGSAGAVTIKYKKSSKANG
jgi:hypothetical protein